VAGVEGGISPTCGETVVRISNREEIFNSAVVAGVSSGGSPPAIPSGYGTPGRDLYSSSRSAKASARRKKMRAFFASPIRSKQSLMRPYRSALGCLSQDQQPLQFNLTEAGL